MSITVKDGNGDLQSVETLPAKGASNAAGSLPVVTASDDPLLAALALVAPARQVFAISPNDVTAISPLPRGFQVTGAGNVVFRTIDSGADVTLPVLAGQVYPFRVQYIRSTNTTATGIVGLA